MTFYEELKRRNVVKVTVLYIVASWLILQIADVLSSLLPVPEWTGSLVFLFLALGFPLVLIFSWVYELTSEGLKRERDVDRSQSITHETGRKINIVIVVMLALAIATVVVDRLMPRQEPAVETVVVEEADEPEPVDPSQLVAEKFAPAPDRSIAVLPFADMSPDKDQEYLSDGLSEELLNLLAKIPELRVASRTSAFSFKGKDVKIAEVAAELNVAHVLEGSVRKAGNRVRITAQLIDANSDVHLWSETWDRTLDDVFAIQDEIASNVVDELRVTLLGETPTIEETDPEAYNLYLQARHLARQGSRESMRQAAEMYEQVLVIDSSYVPAWNGLASNYTNMSSGGALTNDEAYGKAKDAIDRSLAIDPQNGQAYALLAWYHDVYKGDYSTAARYYQKAMELAPNDDRILNGVAVFFSTLGRFDEAIAVHKILIERDPVSAVARHNIGTVYLSARDFDDAKASFDKAVALSPDMVLARIFHGFMFYVNGDYQSYVEAFGRLSDDTGDNAFRLVAQAASYPELGRGAEGEEALRALEQQHGDDWAYVIATIHARQGGTDQAFGWLERAYEVDGASGISNAGYDFMLESLHDDPRWEPLLEKAGVSPAQLAAVDFSVELPDK
jgi:TolB-like protein/Tfp pilus assembly protein PilF